MSSTSVPSGFSNTLAHQQSRLTPQRAKFHIRQAIGGPIPPDLDEFEFINEAGHFLTTMHPWKWLEAGEVKLDLRANITVIGATATPSVSTGNDTQVVATTSVFTDYTHLEGDVLEITGGGNLNKGFYRISRIVSNTTIELDDSPLASASNGTSLTGTVHASAAALPNDFREIIAIYAQNGTNNHVSLTTFQDLLEKRSVNATSPGTYYAAISHAVDANPTITATDTSGTLVGPTPRLELWPAPTANEVGGISVFYRSGWDVTSSDVHNLKMPGYCESLYLEMLRAFVRARFSPEYDLSAALSSIMVGPLFGTAVDWDGSVQPSYGPVLHGAATRAAHRHAFDNYDTVTGPS